MNTAITPAIANLDLLSFPLAGSQLIEASAGTGKTFTIAALYLRLVLGHGCDKALLPPDILVVTFTEAATAELKGRIQQRLSDAALVFAGELPWKDFWLIFAGPTLAGNIVGGSFIFALISHAQVRSDSGKPPSRLLDDQAPPSPRRQAPGK